MACRFIFTDLLHVLGEVGLEKICYHAQSLKHWQDEMLVLEPGLQNEGVVRQEDIQECQWRMRLVRTSLLCVQFPKTPIQRLSRHTSRHECFVSRHSTRSSFSSLVGTNRASAGSLRLAQPTAARREILV